MPDKQVKVGPYIIVNLMREFWNSAKNRPSWMAERRDATEYKTIEEAIKIATPLSMKSHVVANYGEGNEEGVYRNFSTGRRLVWGRREH